MIDFASPWFALLLPLPWLVARWLPGRAGEEGALGSGPALLHPALGRLEMAFSWSAPASGVSATVRQLLAGLLWASLVVTLMRPQWLEWQTEVTGRGYDLVLAVDASRSMEALDFTVDGRPVSRMAVVKGVVGRFITQRQGDRLGLVIFGDSAYLLSPLTVDNHAVRTLLENVEPRMAGDATAIGDAIALAVKKLRERPEGSRVLVLLTDGENTSGSLPPLEAARLAAHYGVRVYAVAVGSKGKAPIMQDGRMVYEDMPIDEDLLRRIAEMSQGAFFRATDTQALKAIYAKIDSLEKTESEAHGTYVPRPLFRWPLALGLLTMLWLVTLSLRRSGAAP